MNIQVQSPQVVLKSMQLTINSKQKEEQQNSDSDYKTNENCFNNSDFYDLNSSNDEIDGEDKENLMLDDYPLDTVLIRSEQRTIYDICRRIKKGQFILDPDFQREFIWSSSRQSLLIESIIMRLPLPVFYLAERQDGKIIVIDGLQRITTIYRFLNNEFALRLSGNILSDLHGKKFNDLSIKFQNRIEDTGLLLYILDEKVPFRAKLDIFERVNSGVPLTRQQMRNCIYSGPATRLLNELSQQEYFLKAVNGGLSSKTMRDREAINRFLAFYQQSIAGYKGDMDSFLGQCLEQLNAISARSYFEIVRDKFILSMRNIYYLFEQNAFRKPPKDGRRSVINIALFDSLSWLFSFIPERVVKENAEYIRINYNDLLENKIFNESITIGTNSIQNVRTRFSLIKNIIPEKFHDYIAKYEKF